MRLAELARDFSYEKDLAFFVVHFHMTPAEFGMLTEKEKMFIRKEHENKLISDTTWTRNAVLNAEANLNRKKHKRFIELFPKKPTKVDKEYNENAVKIIEEMDRNNGQGWIERILKATGMKKAIAKRKE